MVMDQPKTSAGWWRLSDAVVGGVALLTAVWMGLFRSQYLTAGALSMFSVAAAARLWSRRVRVWTDEHRWAFLAILTAVSLIAVAGVYPWQPLPAN
ncbi:hypothetical protein C440_04728 [Haloferax mucosum ATCC BAA-1512]|uniref:Uncharacterized protein n=1 Tax=Haloferax mucosum ATCC BAA-1512 TaxID=662479 RepID=M0IMI8_9EURY|nr:hypothetical protein [Haloferax mucosum]ELZ97053.1 hypothetical protein C440_04728 [Haloferax mucosum ATCC BAA-1512]